MTKFDYFLGRLRKQLWVRPTLLSLVAIGWVSLAYGIQFVYRGHWPFEIEKSTLTNLFAILASSMLTVATFAVSALVGAFSGVSSSSTPRARVLVMSDGTAQTALASFVGAFIYAVVALVALSSLTYGPIGRFGLFVGFVVTVAWVLMAFLRWVALVSNLGGLDDTIDRAESAAHTIFSSHAAIGALHGREYDCHQPIPAGVNIRTTEIGYLCYIDMRALSELAERTRRELWLHVRPGTFIDPARDIVTATGSAPLTDEDLATLRNAFTIQRTRDLAADPRFALIVLAEIADRSLSTSSNDTGTSLRVLGVQLRVFARWAETRREADATPPKFPRIHLPALEVEDLLTDAFMPVARSGAAFVEVSVRLQKTYRALASLGHEELARAARLHARRALDQALETIQIEHHRARLRTHAFTAH